MLWPEQTCSKALTNRVIALAWAVDPLALRVFCPPQLTFGDGGRDVLRALLLLPHAESTSALVARTQSAALNRSNFTLDPFRQIQTLLQPCRVDRTGNRRSVTARRRYSERQSTSDPVAPCGNGFTGRTRTDCGARSSPGS